ncbi:hypothetical protein PT974_01254 [Cladobotryum mycophilum]|uniref:Apple domain-containing protein n=1 Tax=Cladobotryum mycophilum TaxID=491253 RepID=A0ABR0T4A5_9HYPO
MRSLAILQLLCALGVTASPVAEAEDHAALERRKANAYPTCTSPVLRVIDIALTIVGPKATTFCSSYLKATTVTVSLTSSVTAHTTITTTIGSTVLTITSGLASATVVQTAVVTNTITPPTVTATIATPILENRAYQPPPYTPPPLGGVAASVASKACSCFLGPSKSITVTKTTTISLTNYATVPATVYTTIPSSTKTLTQTETKTSAVTLPAATETVYVGGKKYTRVYGPAAGCVYNRYTDYIDIHGDVGSSSDSYLAGRTACAKRCNDKSNCLWWFFYIDLDGASRGYPAWCLLDDMAYQPSYIQCAIPWSGYNNAPTAMKTLVASLSLCLRGAFCSASNGKVKVDQEDSPGAVIGVFIDHHIIINGDISGGIQLKNDLGHVIQPLSAESKAMHEPAS